jgi:S1-C subfamily serine protease
MPKLSPLRPSLISAVVFLGFAICASGQDCSGQATLNRHGVVSLEVKKIKKTTGQVIEERGTGFIITPQGYVLTADHVVARDASIDEVKISGAVGSLFGTTSPLRIVDKDKSSDVALLKFLDESHLYSPIRLGDPWDVSVGSPLCSVGFSAPLNADFHANVGSLSSLTGQDEDHGVYNLWTTQLPSNIGESGSPVLRLPDKGVVAIKYGGESPSAVQNMNYIIPINLAGLLILKYAGISIPRSTLNAAPEVSNATVQKLDGDEQVIPVGAWKEFRVRVVDGNGKPVVGAKVAWRTPGGSTLTYVTETDSQGVATATNLYTFPTTGDYTQTAAVVARSTLTGFIDLSKIPIQGSIASFMFKQN